jgi:3-hexulose-6-phosphate synthase
MRLQLAIDTLELSEALSMVELLSGQVDIVELGTPLILREGVSAIDSVKTRFPDQVVLADFKIMDAGAYEASIAFGAGADIVTVLGAAHDETISGTVREARKSGREVMVDLMAVRDKVTRSQEVQKIGADYVCVHTATDREGQNSLSDLGAIRETAPTARIAIAGGIGPDLVHACAPYVPEIVIVGSFITGHADPARAVQEIRARFNREPDTRAIGLS